MAERYNFKYLPLVGKLPGKSMVEQTETAINELASVVYDNVGHVGNLAEEIQAANTNASNALDKATEALETSSRVYIKQIAAVDVNDYYDSELYYINNDGSTNIPVRDSGFLEVKTNDDKTACEQVFIADSTGTSYYRHGRITEQTLGEETTYVVTWSSWYRVATTEYVQAELQDYLPLSGGTLTGVVNGVTPTAGDNSTKIATTAFVNATAKAAIGYYNSVDEMRKSETAIERRPCVTLGYYEPNDGGGGVYIIRQKKENDVDDGGSVLFLDNGNVAELIIEGAINVKQFGAKGNGVNDDITHFINAIDYVAKHKQNETLTSITLSSYVIPIIIPTGIYNISRGLTLPAYICLKGQGDQASEIRAISPMDAVIDIVGDDTPRLRYALKISGIRINCNNVALDGISNYASGVWLDGATFTDIYVYKALQYGIHIGSTWCSNFDHITINGASVGVAFHSNIEGNGFNNNKITNLNIHNCSLIGAFLEMQNSSITTLNIDRMGEYRRKDYSANLSTVTINNIVYDEPCAIYITGMTDTSSIDKLWFEWITKTTIPCILIKNIETYANKQFKAKTIEITDVHIGTACVDIYHILSGIVILDGLRYDNITTTAHIIDTTGANPNTSLFVKNIKTYDIMNNVVNTLKYGAFTAQVVGNNGHIATFCPDYTNAFKYKNGVESFERFDDKTNTYVKYRGSDIVQRDVDNVTFLPQVAFNIKQTYTNSKIPDSWADLGVFPKVAGILPIVTPRSAESAMVIQRGYYTQYQWVTGDDGKNHLQIRITAGAAISISNALFGVAIYIENPTRIE